MKRVVEFSTPWGTYQLPIEIVLEDRTNYYAGIDGFSKESQEYKDEWQWVYDDDFEAIDWLLNNMDWKDVKDHAIKVDTRINVTEKDFWTSSDDFSIRTKD